MKSAPEYTRRYRERFIREGKMVVRGTYYEVTEDIEFNSPSGAAEVVFGGTSNGLREWKIGGTSLGEYLEKHK